MDAEKSASVNADQATPGKQYLRCKSCGYVIEESKLGDVCPACGVKKIMFAPDTDKLSERRRRVLDSHIHGIIVHAPQTLPLFAAVAIPVILLATGSLRADVFSSVKVISFCLPFVVVAALCSGLYDGTVRFRKVTTPILKIKLTTGIAFLVLSIIGAVVAQMGVFGSTTGMLTEEAIQIGCFVCTYILGKLGASINNAKFQG